MRKLFLILVLSLFYNLSFSQSDTIKKSMNKYLLHGKLTAKQGHRDELAIILLEASKLVSTAEGCKLYVVGLDKDDINSVYVTEIWDSKENHDNSLNVKGVKGLITKAIPILDGKPSTGQELEVLGGAGL